MKSMLLALGGLLLAASAAYADEPNPDANGDGRVTRAEYLAFNARQTLAWGDTDRDGRISKAEARAKMGARAVLLDAFWGRVDTNRDGFLARPEMDVMATQGFDRADTNHDGALDEAEIAAARARGRGGRR
jgi:hypothetical protein